MELMEFLKEHIIHLEITFKNITFGLHERHDPDIKIKNFVFINKYQKSIPIWEGFKLRTEQ